MALWPASSALPLLCGRGYPAGLIGNKGVSPPKRGRPSQKATESVPSVQSPQSRDTCLNVSKDVLCTRSSQPLVSRQVAPRVYAWLLGPRNPIVPASQRRCANGVLSATGRRETGSLCVFFCLPKHANGHCKPQRLSPWMSRFIAGYFVLCSNL